MIQPGRKYSATNSYRYGFNGKENDNEVKGVEGSQQDYGMRIYDPRLGKFLSVDPLTKKYPELTPYQFASNKPIQCIDLDGEEDLDFRFATSFSLNFGKQGMRFSISTSAGVSITSGFAQLSSSSNINIYNGGLGTAGKSNRIIADVSTSLYLTMGVGSFAASQVKTINYRTESPIDNNYAASFSFGNAFSYSSGTKEPNKQVFVNFKGGPVTIDYHNDERIFNKGSILAKTIGGSGKDQDFSGGTSITLNTDNLGAGRVFGKISYGFDVYTGIGKYKGEVAPVDLSKYGEDNSGEEKKFYDQTPYQRSLNKSSSYLTIGVVTMHTDNGGQGQTNIHTSQGFNIGPIKIIKGIKNPIFHYDQKGQKWTEIKISSIIL